MKKGEFFRNSFLVTFCFVISRPLKVYNYRIFLLVVEVKRETKDSLLPAIKREYLVPILVGNESQIHEWNEISEVG